MDAAGIVTLARALSGVDALQLSDQTALSYLNLVYDDLWTTVARDVGAERFTHTWYVNLLAGVGTYALPAESPTGIGLLSVDRVSVMYRPDEEYRSARRVEFADFEGDPDIALRDRSPSDPVYVLSDGYLTLYPAPSGTVPSGLKIAGVRTNADLTMVSSEGNIGIPKEFHHVLALGVRAYVLEARGDATEAAAARERYATERARTVEALSRRRIGSIPSSLPDLSRLS